MALNVTLKDPEEREEPLGDIVRSMVDRVKKGAVEKQAREPNEPVEVDLEEDDDDEPEPNAEPRAAGSWAEKKRNRFREQADARATAERDLAQERERTASLERNFALLQNQFTQQQNTLGRQQQADPFEARLTAIEKERRELLKSYNARSTVMTPAELEEMQTQAAALETKKYEVVAERQQARSAPPRQQVQQEVLLGQLTARYPDIMADPHAKTVFQGLYMKKVTPRHQGGEGLPEGWDVGDAAADEARRALNMKTAKPAPPPQGSKERYAGARAAQGGGKAPGSKTVTLSVDQQRMAKARFKTDAKGNRLTEAQSYKMWAEKVGSKLPQRA